MSAYTFASRQVTREALNTIRVDEKYSLCAEKHDPRHLTASHEGFRDSGVESATAITE